MMMMMSKLSRESSSQKRWSWQVQASANWLGKRQLKTGLHCRPISLFSGPSRVYFQATTTTTTAIGRPIAKLQLFAPPGNQTDNICSFDCHSAFVCLSPGACWPIADCRLLSVVWHTSDASVELKSSKFVRSVNQQLKWLEIASKRRYWTVLRNLKSRPNEDQDDDDDDDKRAAQLQLQRRDRPEIGSTVSHAN